MEEEILARKTLFEKLSAKASELRTAQSREHDASVSLIAASAQAAEASATARDHAKAVEEALQIIDRAGVKL